MEKTRQCIHIFRVRIVSNFGEKQMSGKIQTSRVQWRTHKEHRIQYKELLVMWPRSRTRATLPWLFIVQTFIYWITFKSDIWTLYTEGKISASVCMFDISAGPRRDRMNLIWKVDCPNLNKDGTGNYSGEKAAPVPVSRSAKDEIFSRRQLNAG